jgi:hypothetical protein
MLPTINFATRVQISLSTVIDIVDNARLSLSYTSPIVNGLPDHDAQFLTVRNVGVDLAPSK